MIELRCQACNRRLRVPDEALGRQARCPVCSAVNDVPAGAAAGHGAPRSPSPGQSPSRVPGDTPADDFDATLPYQQSAPRAAGRGWRRLANWNPYAAEEPARPAASASITGSRFVSAGDIFARAWTVYLNNLGPIIGASLVVYLLNSLCGLLVNTLYRGAADSSGSQVAVAMIWVITYVAGTAFTVWLTAGLLLYLLRIIRGQPAHFGMLFDAGPLIVPATIATIAYSVIVTLGLLVCIVPGVILGLMYWLAIPLVIDARLEVTEAFRVSRQTTDGHKGTLALVWLISVGLLIAGALVCGIGLVFTLPLAAVLQAVAYLAITGQDAGLPPQNAA